MAEQDNSSPQINESMNPQNKTLSENPEPQLTAWQKIMYIFTNPNKTLATLRTNPTWLLPLLLIMAMTVIFTVATKDLMIEYRKEVILNSDKIPEEQKDLMLERMDNMTPKAYYIQSIGGGLVGLVLVYLFASAIFIFVGNFILGGKASFKQIFSLYVWGNMVSLIELPVKGGLALAKGSAQVYTSLAVLMDPAQNKTVLFQLLNAVDVFNIWRIILWAIGFAYIYHFSPKKSYITVISIYVFYIFISIGLGRFFI